ncbi:MAG TPA: GNAT family protein [Acidimicrobiales bacterium]|nr:GNAT family protein [Acidimicrobiales bacterium]
MQWRPSCPIVTARLALRPLAEADVEDLLAYRGRPDVCRYLPFEPMDREVLTARLAGDLGRDEITAEGQALTLGVELAGSGRLVGDVVLFVHSARHAGGEIGYVFHPDVAGQGYATEACTALLERAFDGSDGLGLHRVVARMDARNIASERLARRLGMRREAHHRSCEMFKGEWSDLVVYALLAHEWRARRDGPGTAVAAAAGSDVPHEAVAGEVEPGRRVELRGPVGEEQPLGP